MWKMFFCHNPSDTLFIVYIRRDAGYITLRASLLKIKDGPPA